VRIEFGGGDLSHPRVQGDRSYSSEKTDWSKVQKGGIRGRGAFCERTVFNAFRGQYAMPEGITSWPRSESESRKNGSIYRHIPRCGKKRKISDR